MDDWDKDRVDLSWEPPLTDGGAAITNYLIECKERFSSNWVQCHLTSDETCKGSVTDVIVEGKSYEFRVKAVNKAGPGLPSEPTKQVAIKSRFVKPFIVGDGMKDIVIKCGNILSWDITYKGEPDPEVKWLCGDQEIVPNDRITIDKYSRNTVLTIRKCDRKDTAKYKLVISNSVGEAETSADGVVLGSPARPGGPLEVTDVRAKKATLKWKKPEDDGGTPITHYQLEKLDLDTGKWIPCGEAPADAEEFKVEGLQPGKKYKFRVKAVNKEGASEPLESKEPVEAKNPYREPDPPRNLEIHDWDNKSVTLRWKEPKFNGGRPVTHYIIEQKGKFDVDFIEVLKTKDASLEAVVEDLREKQLYEFRARAVNKAGPSLPCEPTPKHLVKHRNSKKTFCSDKIF